MRHDPHALLYLVVRRMLDPAAPFSRNQNFEAYNDALVRRARRIAGILRRVTHSVGMLEAHGHRLSALRRTAQGEIVLGMQEADARVEHTLNAAQWEILLEQPDVASLLTGEIQRLEGKTRLEAQAVMDASAQP